MLSYADRAKSKGKSDSRAELQPSASTSVSSVSPISTPPSSVAAAPILSKGDISSLTETTEAAAEISHESTPTLTAHSSAPLPTPTTTLPNTLESLSISQKNVESITPPSVKPSNIWEQRARARASGQTPVNTPPANPRPNDRSTAAVPENNMPKGDTNLSNQAKPSSGAAVDDQAWPEVGPSSGLPRATSRIRELVGAEKDAAASKKGEKTRWVPIPPAELQAAVDQVRASSRPRSLRSPNKASIGISSTHPNTTSNSNNVGSASSSRRTSPLRSHSRFTPTTSHSPRQFPREHSRPQSQYSSTHNSPYRTNVPLARSSLTGDGEYARDPRGDRPFPQPYHDMVPGNMADRPPSLHPQMTHQNPNVDLPHPPSNNTLPITPAPSHHPPYPGPYPPPQGYPYPPVLPQYDLQNLSPPLNGDARHLPFSLAPPLIHSPAYSYHASVPPNFSRSNSDITGSLQPSSTQGPPVRLPSQFSPPTTLAVPTWQSGKPLSFVPTISPRFLPASFSPPQAASNDNHAERAKSLHPITTNTSPVSDAPLSSKIPIPKTNGKKITFGTLESRANSPYLPAFSNECKVKSTIGDTTEPTGKGVAIGFSNSLRPVVVSVDTRTSPSTDQQQSNAARWTFGSWEASQSPSNSPVIPLRGPPDFTSSTPSALGLTTLPLPSGTGDMGDDADPATSSRNSPLMAAPSIMPPTDVPQANWGPPYPAHSEQSPASPGDFEVRNFGYGFGAPHPGSIMNDRNYYVSEDGQPVYPNLGREYEMYNMGYYHPSQYPPYQQRRRYYETEQGRVREEWNAPDGVPRGRGRGFGRRGRGTGGRGFGRGYRGDGPRNRDHIPYHQYPSPEDRGEFSHRPPGLSPPPHNSDGYPMDYGFYGQIPPGAPGYYPQNQQPLPQPITIPSFPLDPMRMYLLGQVEYYFSVQNLAKDTHLRRQMDHEGWIPILTISAFNRIRQLTGNTSLEHAGALVKEVLTLSTLVEVDQSSDRVRLAGDKWRDFILPPIVVTPNDDLSRDKDTDSVEDVDGEDTDDDIVFVMGKDGSPARRNWPIASPAARMPTL